MKLTREQLLVARKKCDESLLFFTRFFYKELRGTKFIVNDHHEVIENELHRVENYELELLNINIPPRFSKTELAAVNFIARGIGMNPTGNYLYITASDELRSQTSVSIRDIVNHPYFKIMYGVDLKKDQNGKNLWRTTEGGGLKTATIFGQITGFGAGQMVEYNKDIDDIVREFEGCIVIDDANKTDDSQTENANNDKVSRVFFNTILSRKNSKDTPIINIQQRAGLSDLTAQLEEHYKDDERAKFLVMPVVKDGVPLWEWKHDLEDIHKLKTSPKTAHVFETQYMQNPLPGEGVMFRRDELNYFTLDEIDYSMAESRLSASDIADKGKDYLSTPIGYVYSDKVYITDWLYSQQNMEYTAPEAGRMITEHKVDHALIETNNQGGDFLRQVSKMITSVTNIYPIMNTGNKHTRIINKAQFIRQYFVFRSDIKEGSNYDKAMKHLLRYMKDGSFKIDDAPDSLAMLAGLSQDLFGYKFI